MGLAVPPATYGVTPIMASESEQVPAVTGVDIEERFEPQADGSISGEVTFSGNANEVVLLHLDNADRYPIPGTLELYGPTGKVLPGEYNYPDIVDFQEAEGLNLAFLLPETGEYRLVLADEALNFGDETLDLSYRLRIRLADYYERLMMTAEIWLEQGRYEEAIGLFAQAVDDSPERPGAYLSRVLAYAEMLYETPEFNARLDELAFEGDTSGLFNLIYETFTTLETEEQSLIFSDLRQLEQLYVAANLHERGSANANGETEEEFDPALLGGLVEFLETGVPTEAVRLLFFGTTESVEPAVIPAEPEGVLDESQH